MNRQAIQSLIPHQGSMCLLDRMVCHDEKQIHCRARSHQDADNPLRQGQAVHAVHLVEYAAQAAALHSVLQQPRTTDTPQAGLLAAVRNLQLEIQDLAGVRQPLEIFASRQLISDSGLIYSFNARAGDQPLAQGRLTILLQAAP